MRRHVHVVGFFVLYSSLFASAQFRTVTVQNAINNPVPVTVQNTPTVSVNGTVPVTGTVGITGNVNTTITGTPSVTVTNAVGSPVPTRNNDDGVRSSFTVSGGGNIPLSTDKQTFTIALPNDPSVLEYVSMLITGVTGSTPGSQQVSYVEIDGSAISGGVATNFFPATVIAAPLSGGQAQVVSMPTHLYFGGGGQSITVIIQLSTTNTLPNGAFKYAFQGHTVTP